jgi:hypothetical protein
MTTTRLRNLAPTLLLGTGMLLFVVLFLDWRSISVTAGVVVDAGQSGWSGWGAAAGGLLASMVAVELIHLMRGVELGRRLDAIVFALALGVLVLVAAAFTDSTVSVFVGPVTVETGAREWPAYVGLVLASLQAVLALVPLLPEPAPMHRPTHGTA